MRIVNRSRGVDLGDQIEWAGSSGSRKKGLLGRDTLPRGEGLYLVPCQWIHMFGMRFPIDVVFVDRNGKVLTIHHALKPNRISKLVWRAEGALELPAGTLAEAGTEIGDQLRDSRLISVL